MFFEVNALPGEKREPKILTLMGSKVYSLLRSISAPRKPKELSFTEIVDSLAQHLDLKPTIIAERYKFHKAAQGESESILLQSVVEKACAAELTEKETSVVHGDSVVKKVERSTVPECFRCGKTNHTPDSCFHLKSRCHRCQKTGHIATKCTVTPLPQRPPVKRGTIRGKMKKQGRIGNLQEVEAVEESVNKSVWPMFTIVNSRRRCKEFIVPVVIEGKNVDIELDTGASVTIIPKNVWYDILATKPLKETDLKLRSYSGHKIPVVREAEVRVSHHN
ncbi:uncharacterized protein [Montipora capricornis]|uniref:uncharacterized protein n=1 Tax=Montipora capricornis TaxID=246305 RepID=UPI0035F15C92